MRTRRLDAAQASLTLQIGMHAHAREAALRSGATAEFLIRLGLPDLVGQVGKDRRKTIQEHFERAGRQIRRQGFVDLVSSFEADLFRLLNMATSKTRHMLNRHYGADLPFGADRAELARTTGDFANLGGYRRLLATMSSSSPDPRRALWDVVSHRDLLVHGERWPSPGLPPSLEDAYRILSRELDRVEPTSR